MIVHTWGGGRASAAHSCVVSALSDRHLPTGGDPSTAECSTRNNGAPAQVRSEARKPWRPHAWPARPAHASRDNHHASVWAKYSTRWDRALSLPGNILEFKTEATTQRVAKIRLAHAGNPLLRRPLRLRPGNLGLKGAMLARTPACLFKALAVLGCLKRTPYAPGIGRHQVEKEISTLQCTAWAPVSPLQLFTPSIFTKEDIDSDGPSNKDTFEEEELPESGGRA